MSDLVSGTVDRVVTLEEFQRMSEEEYRVELVRGRVVREPLPGAQHGRVTLRLGKAIDDFATVRGLGITLVETGFVLSVDPPTVRGADIAFVAQEKLAREPPPVGFWPGAPDLAVEVVSPSNHTTEIREKVLEYLASGSRLVWVVDPATRTVAVYRSRSDIRLLAGEEVLGGGDVLPGFKLPLPVLFEVLDPARPAEGPRGGKRV